MLTLELPDTNPILVEIRSDEAVTKGGPAVKDQIVGVVALGEPYVLPITLETVKDDLELTDFITANSTEASFFVLHTACTFYPQEGEAFVKAWLNFTLARDDGGEAPKPIVWSMRPEKQITEVQLSSSAKLGASLKFQDAGVEAGTDIATSWKQEIPYLQAFLIDSEPFWEFTANDKAVLKGTYKLSMIIRVPTTTVGVSKMTLRTTVQRKKMGIIPYTTDFPNAPQFAIVLK
jgi:hypothetical protein